MPLDPAEEIRKLSVELSAVSERLSSLVGANWYASREAGTDDTACFAFGSGPSSRFPFKGKAEAEAGTEGPEAPGMSTCINVPPTCGAMLPGSCVCSVRAVPEPSSSGSPVAATDTLRAESGSVSAELKSLKSALNEAGVIVRIERVGMWGSDDAKYVVESGSVSALTQLAITGDVIEALASKLWPYARDSVGPCFSYDDWCERIRAALASVSAPEKEEHDDS